MSPIDQPQPNHPLTAIRRQGVVQDIANAPTTINVFIGGDSNTLIACSYVAEYAPVAGDTVLVLENQGDYIVIGALAGLSPVVTNQWARYAWSRTGLGIANGATVHIGTPPNTSWSTGSSSATTSTISITKDCHFDLWASVFTGQFGLRLTFNTSSQSPAHDEGPTTQGGGIYNQAVHWSGLAISGETFTITARNLAGGLADLHANSFITFTDARWTVAQV